MVQTSKTCCVLEHVTKSILSAYQVTIVDSVQHAAQYDLLGSAETFFGIFELWPGQCLGSKRLGGRFMLQRGGAKLLAEGGQAGCCLSWGSGRHGFLRNGWPVRCSDWRKRSCFLRPHGAIPCMQSIPFPLLLGAVLLTAWVCLRAYTRRWRPMRLVTIIDGDTFMAVDMRGKERKLRLLGVDCPEMNQKNGPEAKAFVQSACGKAVVRVRLKGRDKYRRHLADVQVSGTSLALLLVRAGMAYSLGGSLRLRAAAAGAWLARRGVHKGFGQQKPWNSSSRKPGLLRWFSYRMGKNSKRK